MLLFRVLCATPKRGTTFFEIILLNDAGSSNNFCFISNGEMERGVGRTEGERERERQKPWNTKGGRIIVPLTSCLTGLESAL
jgi:hypothetical protein